MAYSRIITITMRNKKIIVPLTIILLLLAALLSIIISGYTAINRAENQFAEKNYADAAESYQLAAQRFPWREDLWEKTGIAFASSSNFSQAIFYLEKLSAPSAEGLMWLSFSYQQLGNYPAAIQSIQQAIQINDLANFYKILALLYRHEKDWPSERNALEDQLLRDSSDVYARYRLGLLLTVLEPEQALSDLMLASSLDPQFDPAVQTLRAALNLSATQPDASSQMVTIGRALGLVQEWDLSIVAFENAITLNAENAEAWAWLGEAKQQTDLDGRVELDQAAALDHTSVVVRALRGLYWNRQKKYPQMLAEYLLAARYEPENPAWQAELGNAYTLNGDLAIALTAYQHATELAPNDSTYWRLLAIFCNENGVYLENVGLPAAQKAVELAPNDPLALDTLGWSYLSTGRYANAEKILLDVIERYPELFSAHIHLAMTYLAQGNHPAAFNELTYVRDADSGGASGLFAEQLLAKYFP